MSNLTEEPKLLLPSNPIIKEATLTSFKKFKGIDKAATENFFGKAGDSIPAPIGATASVIFGAIYGNVTIKLTSNYVNCKFDHDFWGLGVAGGQSVGFLYTAYDNWDAFFENVAGFHIQGIAEAGGILQVNFFLKNATPVGQYNGVMIGVSAFEGGNSGKWSCS